MSYQQPDSTSDRLDQAVAQRLADLATRPVATSRLDTKLMAVIPRRQRSPFRLRLPRPVAALAASVTILIAVAAAVMLSSSSSQVLASPAQMAQVHRDIIANKLAVTRVASTEEAAKVLSEQSGSQAPPLPNSPDASVMACCMKSIDNKKMACVLLESNGKPITMSVARSDQIRHPTCPPVMHDGRMFHAQKVDELNMVMSEQGDQWVCLMSQLPQDQLIDIASRLRF